MASFAEIDESSIVIRVIAVSDEDTQDENGNEVESIGAEFCNKLLGGTWKQTSYNTAMGIHRLGGTPLRGNYAGIGYTWDEDNNIFYGKKPYPSWVLNTTTASWHSPIGDAPDDLTDEEKAAGTFYEWNEGTGAWDKITPAT